MALVKVNNHVQFWLIEGPSKNPFQLQLHEQVLLLKLAQKSSNTHSFNVRLLKDTGVSIKLNFSAL